MDPEELRILKEKWQKALENGQLRLAEGYIAQAYAWTCEHGDARQRDFVICARAAVAIQLGCGEREIPALRAILLQSKDLSNSRLAAYHISLHYELAKNFKKSLFYARIALNRAQRLERQDWLAASYNQTGNALLGDSSVDQARAEYEKALELSSPEPTVWRAAILHNLGYCRILAGRFAEGYRMLYESLRIQRRFEAERYQIPPRLDLCFAHLETGRYRQALRQGARALELA
jgi:tetratricopeptide (TPR) repeat protein